MSFFKRAARGVLRRPARFLLRPLLRRISEVNDLAERVHRHLPIVESVIESQNAELRSRARAESAVYAEIERLKHDLRQMRCEVDNLRLGVGGNSRRGPQESPSDEPQGLVQVPARNGSEVRLEFAPHGAGEDRVGVDLGDWHGDLVSRLRELPLAECSAIAIRTTAVLECFTITELREVVIPLWHSLLRPGGELQVVSVDADANLADYGAGRLTMEQLATASFGAADQRPPRRAMLGADMLRGLLEQAGFESVEIVSKWRGRDGTNMIETRARRGGVRPAQVPSGTRADR